MLEVLPAKRPSWTPLTQEGCVNVIDMFNYEKVGR